MNDQALYSSGDIRVDWHFARFGEKSYAINKINSVEVKRIPAKPNAKIHFIIVSLGMGIIALMAQSFWWVLGSFIFAGFAYKSHRNPNSDKFQLYLMTSSSEVQAMETEDKTQISELRAAIETAMTREQGKD